MTPLQTCRALHARCVLAFEEDPGVEVGKIRRSNLAPESWFFHVYVLAHDGVGIRSQHSNTIVCGPGKLLVDGPDEVAIGRAIKEQPF
jgi:hypothetical protein